MGVFVSFEVCVELEVASESEMIATAIKLAKGLLSMVSLLSGTGKLNQCAISWMTEGEFEMSRIKVSTISAIAEEMESWISESENLKAVTDCRTNSCV